ncbi:hypothetical protein ACLOJK_020508 [Asimina triloba]
MRSSPRSRSRGFVPYLAVREGMSGTGRFPVLPLPSTIARWRGRSVNVSCVANKGRKQVRERAKKSQLSSSSARKTGFGAGGRKEEWRCIGGCGACCKLDKGPSFATPEEIFESPSDVQVLEFGFFDTSK